MTVLPRLVTDPPRARGEVVLSVGHGPRGTTIRDLRHSGSLRALFPRGHDMQVVLTNTSGGVTGGDRFRTRITAEAGAQLSVTTQAAERAYRALDGQEGRIGTTLTVAEAAHIAWLPQELILFDGSALQRRLTVELTGTASALVVEPVVFGRTAMGETVRNGQFHDRIEIRRDGAPLYLDQIRLSGDLEAHLRLPAVSGGGLGMATVLFAHPAAEAQLDALRALLPKTAGASLVQDDLIVARIVAPDGYALRQTLMAAIRLLTRNAPPRPWML